MVGHISRLARGLQDEDRYIPTGRHVGCTDSARTLRHAEALKKLKHLSLNSLLLHLLLMEGVIFQFHMNDVRRENRGLLGVFFDYRGRMQHMPPGHGRLILISDLCQI